MPRVPRYLFPDGIFHVGTRGVDRCTVFVDDFDRLLFLRLLGSVVADHGWDVHALCLMTNHYHLVVETERALLSVGMRRLNGRYAETFNRKFRRTGHLWGDRFWSRLVEDDDGLERVCRYVVHNPVRAGICADRRDWRWAACRAAF